MKTFLDWVKIKEDADDMVGLYPPEYDSVGNYPPGYFNPSNPYIKASQKEHKKKKCKSKKKTNPGTNS
jgi:hypothetical protein